MDFDLDDDDDDRRDRAPWALDDDEPETPEAGLADDGPTAADRWLEAQLGELRPPRREQGEAGGAGATLAVKQFDDTSEGIVLRRPAPPRPPRRRRAHPDGVADLPAADVPGYLRDRRGTWRYSATGQAVPAARDLTLRWLYRFPVRRSHVLVPLDQVRTEAELGWCMTWKHTLTTSLWSGRSVSVVQVPVGEWERRADIPIGLWAPELTVARLLGIGDVARIAGVTPATITAYLARRRMPPPVSRIADSPVWSRPVIRHWMASRPGQGVRPR
jgi:predicted DNA-binding transcriptional regulator AlpA